VGVLRALLAASADMEDLGDCRTPALVEAVEAGSACTVRLLAAAGASAMSGASCMDGPSSAWDLALKDAEVVRALL
jgi:hypothetical protein